MEQQLEKKKRHKTLQEYIEEKEVLMEDQKNNLWKLGELASNVEKDYGKDSFGKWVGKVPAIKTAYGWREVYNLGEKIKILSPQKFQELCSKLSWYHFKLVLGIAKENLEEAIKLLQKAVEKNYSCDDLQQEVRGEIVKEFEILKEELQGLPIEEIKELVAILVDYTTKIEKFDKITLIGKEANKVGSITDDIRLILSNMISKVVK